MEIWCPRCIPEDGGKLALVSFPLVRAELSSDAGGPAGEESQSLKDREAPSTTAEGGTPTPSHGRLRGWALRTWLVRWLEKQPPRVRIALELFGLASAIYAVIWNAWKVYQVTPAAWRVLFGP